jgi:small-conductance mechanosensitive channel
MFAAVFNGLTLPYFLNQYSERLEENIEVLKPITNYSFAINIPLDYIFIIACCIAILIYSIIILLENKFPKWIGYLGAFIVLFSIVGGLTGFIFTSLTGFRVFTFSIAVWILSSGVLLYKYDK